MRLKYKAEKDPAVNTNPGFVNPSFTSTVRIYALGRKVVFKTRNLTGPYFPAKKYIFYRKKLNTAYFKTLTDYEKKSLACVVDAMLKMRGGVFAYSAHKQNKLVAAIPCEFLSFSDTQEAFVPINSKQEQSFNAKKAMLGEKNCGNINNDYKLNSESETTSAQQDSFHDLVH